MSQLIIKSAVFAVLPALLTVSSVFAQQIDVEAGETEVEVGQRGVSVDTDTSRPNERKIAGPSIDQRMNHQIADWLIVDQQAVIDLANFGLERTKTPEVRQLAERIVQDHRALIDQLNAVGSVNRSGASAAERRDDLQDERAEAAREVRRDARRERDGVRRPLENIVDRVEDGVERIADRVERTFEGEFAEPNIAAVPTATDASWVQIHRQIKDRLNAVARQDLEKRSGYEFDAALVGMLVASHLQQEATMEVLSKWAEGDLSNTLTKASETIRHHRQEAEHVMGQTARRE